MKIRNTRVIYDDRKKNLWITYLILEFWKKNFADNKNDFNFSKFQSI